MQKTLTYLLAISLLSLPVCGQRQLSLPTDEQIFKRLPDDVSFIPNIAYREGNEAWKLDLAMPTERSDVKNAVRWLRAHADKYNVDSNRIGATGNSAGAHLSVMLGLCPKDAGLEGDGPYQDYSSAVQAVAASATPTSFLIPMSNRARERFEQETANPNAERDVIHKKNSPATYVSADTPPLLLFHETSDKTVGVYQSDTFVQALRDAGAKDINYMLFGDGSGHGVFQHNLTVTEPAREAFFARTLKHGEK